MAISTNLELIVRDFLEKRNIRYEAQAWVRGGIFALGGAVVDFLVEPNLAWRVLGEYWHRGVEKTGQDIIQREMLEAEGYVVIDLLEDDLINRTEETLQLALQGQSMLR